MSRLELFNLAFGLFSHARVNPAATALVVDEREYSYASLARSAGAVATWLRARPPGEAGVPRVGVLAARSLETYAGILGTAWAGGTYVPLNPKQPAARLAVILERMKLDALIVDQKGAARVPDLGPATPENILAGPSAADLSDPRVTQWESLDKLPPAAPPTPIPPEQPAYVIFTSGTTGVPKGVVVTASNIAHFLAASRAIYGFGPDDRVAQFFETTFDVSVTEMFGCWSGGGALHVVPETKVMAPGGFIRQHEITIKFSVPSLVLVMQRMNQLQPGAMPSLRRTTFGGEGAPVASMQAWRAAAPNSKIVNLYGPTEATVGCSFQFMSESAVQTAGRGTLSIGRPLPGMHSAIVSEDLKFLGPNETGELAVSGPQVAAGYFDDEQQTARRFPTLDHPTFGPRRWYLTGDSAFVDDAGHFHCLGRLDNQVKVMGFRVELEEVEAHLRAACGTEAVAAVAWPVANGNGNASGIVAFVAGGNLTPGAVREQLRMRVPAYMLPTRVLPLDALPLSTNGKVDRKELRAILEKEPSVQPNQFVTG
jgi:D-alanine--poly(phosphoribitol) ligase subunit 1